jgi:hypothetical protein
MIRSRKMKWQKKVIWTPTIFEEVFANILPESTPYPTDNIFILIAE